MKRIVLFLATNLAVVARAVGRAEAVRARPGAGGARTPVRPAARRISLVVGFTGAIISLLMSKSIAKWIDRRAGDRHAGQRRRGMAARDRAQARARRPASAMPEVAIYEGEPNAFATGAFKNSALVAVSTGLLQSMNQEEVEAVLGHELSHVANGDMVTLTLIQGVVNTFVIFLVAHRRLDRRSHRVPHRARHRARLLHHRDRLPDRVRHPRVDDRRVVLAPARVPRRRRQRAAPRPPQPMIHALRAPRRPRGRPAARRRCRRSASPGGGGMMALFAIASADRGTHRGAARSGATDARRSLAQLTHACATRSRCRTRRASGPTCAARTAQSSCSTTKRPRARRSRSSFPILVQMEQYAGGKRTRVIRILEDEDDWRAGAHGRSDGVRRSDGPRAQREHRQARP